MAKLINIDAETGAVTVMASPDELKMLQQTLTDERHIATYLRVDSPA